MEYVILNKSPMQHRDHLTRTVTVLPSKFGVARLSQIRFTFQEPGLSLF